METPARRPTLAVHKFSSCDGCQLSLLDLEEHLLTLTERVDIAWFREATSRTSPGPWDLVLVEGSISSARQVREIHEVREQARRLVTIGACATAGGVQALRNFTASQDVTAPVDLAWAARAYPRPELLDSLARSRPVSDFVPVDYELHGCPVDKGELLEVVLAFLDERRPAIADESVCAACKRRGTPCLTVTRGMPCMGPVTRSGCGAICPAYGRGCYGCFGPKEHARVDVLDRAWRDAGLDAETRRRLRQGIQGWAPPFRELP